MSELKDLLSVVDKLVKDVHATSVENADLRQGLASAREELTRLQKLTHTTIAAVIEDISLGRKESVEFQQTMYEIIKSMGFDIKRLARDKSCREIV